MKKVLSLLATSFMLVLPLLGSSPVTKVNAYEPVGSTACGEGLVNVKVHYHVWNDDYSDIGLGTWGTGAGGTNAPVWVAEKDDFGAIFNICVNPLSADDSIGFLPFRDPKWAQGPGASWDWTGDKLTRDNQDTLIPVTDVKTSKAGKEVYIFEGSGGDADKTRGVYTVNPTKKNVLVVYYDPSGAYEEKLGMHLWSDWDPIPGVEFGGWGTPTKVFSDGSVSPTNVTLKGAMLTIPADKNAGGLIYAGDDSSKKLPFDLNAPFENFANIPAGKVGIALVAAGKLYAVMPSEVTSSAGYDSAKVSGGLAEFAEEAFKFELKPYSVDTGMGTHAINPTTVVAETNVAVATPADQTAAKALFTLVDADGTAVEIDSIDFNDASTSNKVFILNLKTALDASKVYTLSYLGAPAQDEIEVNQDLEAPVITVSKPRITIFQGTAWDPALLPSFTAEDNRDGDITDKIFIPAGKGTFNTGVLGEYTITLRVADLWGNVTDTVFVISVVAPADNGGCAGSAAAGTNTGLGYLVVFLLAGFLFKKALVK